MKDFKAEKNLSGARERAGAAIGMHLLIGISPQWLKEFGDLNDVRNHRHRDLFNAVKAFAEENINGVYAMRMDLDERGGGVVDVFAAPVHVRQAKLRKNGTRGAGVCEISAKSALAEFQKRAGGGKSFAALQSLWAAHANLWLDSRIVRGVPKEITGREHLTVPQFRQAAEEAAAHNERMIGERQTVVNSLLFINEERAKIAEQMKDLRRREGSLGTAVLSVQERSIHIAQLAESNEQQHKKETERLATERAKLDEVRLESVSRMALREAAIVEEKRAADRLINAESIELWHQRNDLESERAIVDEALTKSEAVLAKDKVFAAGLDVVGAGIPLTDARFADDGNFACVAAQLRKVFDAVELRTKIERAKLNEKAQIAEEVMHRAEDRELQADHLHRETEGLNRQLQQSREQLDFDRKALADRRSIIENERNEERAYLGKQAAQYEALRTGIAMIGTGALDRSEQLDNEPQLRPARTFLGHIIDVISRRTEVERKELRKRESEARVWSTRAKNEADIARRALLENEAGSQAITIRKKELDAREVKILYEESASERKRYALVKGLRLVFSGKVRAERELDQHPDLAPARDMLSNVVTTISLTSGETVQRYESAMKRAKVAKEEADTAKAAAEQARIFAETKRGQADIEIADAIERQRSATTEMRMFQRVSAAVRSLVRVLSPIAHSLGPDVLKAFQALRDSYAPAQDLVVGRRPEKGTGIGD